MELIHVACHLVFRFAAQWVPSFLLLFTNNFSCIIKYSVFIVFYLSFPESLSRRKVAENEVERSYFEVNITFWRRKVTSLMDCEIVSSQYIIMLRASPKMRDTVF